jgi:hypothetical protein
LRKSLLDDGNRADEPAACLRQPEALPGRVGRPGEVGQGTGDVALEGEVQAQLLRVDDPVQVQHPSQVAGLEVRP